MLAHDFTKQGHKMPQFVCFQPKIDGVRLIVNGGVKAKAVSRAGRPLVVNHILEQVAHALGPDEYLDGKLYISGKPFEGPTGIVREHDEACKKELVYNVFDMFTLCPNASKATPATFLERMARLKSLFDGLDTPNVEIVETIRGSLADVDAALKSYVEQGHEGLIIRDPDGVYEMDKRITRS
jgi:ATP-dependent DNA ligase